MNMDEIKKIVEKAFEKEKEVKNEVYRKVISFQGNI